MSEHGGILAVEPPATPPHIKRSRAGTGCLCSLFSQATTSYFIEALEQGDNDLVARMLVHDIKLLKAVFGRRSRSAWHVAAELGHVEVLRVLVNAVLACKNAEYLLNSPFRRMFKQTRTGDALVRQLINSTCARGGRTPLMAAARTNQTAAIDYLLCLGANPWIYDNFGFTALHVAARHNKFEAIHELLRHDPPYSKRAHSRNVALTQYVNVIDPFGWTPLHQAVLANATQAVSTLLSHDANLVSRTLLHNLRIDMLPSGVTALHIAAYLGSLPLVKILLRAYYEGSADLVPSQTALLATGERRRRARNNQPDPRLVITRTARLAYHFAHRLDHYALLEWLDPSIPLMFLFSGSGDEADQAAVGGITVGVARLTVLAAKALHTMLLTQLAGVKSSLEASVKEQADLQCKAVTASPPSRVPLLGTLLVGGQVTPTGAPQLTARVLDRLLTLVPAMPARKGDESGTSPAELALLEARIGITIPANPEQDPVATFRHAAPPQVLSSCGRVTDSELAFPDSPEGRRALRFSEPGAAVQMPLKRSGLASIPTCPEEAEGLIPTAHGAHPPSQEGMMGEIEAHPPHAAHAAQNSGPPLYPCATPVRTFHLQSCSLPLISAARTVPGPSSISDTVPGCVPGSDLASALAVGPLESIPEPMSALLPAALLGFAPELAAANTPVVGFFRQSLLHRNSTGSLLSTQGLGPQFPAHPRQSISPRERSTNSGVAVRNDSWLRHLRLTHNQVAPQVDSPAIPQRSKGSAPLISGDVTAVVNGRESGVEDEDDFDQCPVCLDAPPDIQLRGCAHHLCCGCAKDLCVRHQLTPALCPLCRAIIPGFCARTQGR